MYGRDPSLLCRKRRSPPAGAKGNDNVAFHTITPKNGRNFHIIRFVFTYNFTFLHSNTVKTPGWQVRLSSHTIALCAYVLMSKCYLDASLLCSITAVFSCVRQNTPLLSQTWQLHLVAWRAIFLLRQGHWGGA